MLRIIFINFICSVILKAVNVLCRYKLPNGYKRRMTIDKRFYGEVEHIHPEELIYYIDGGAKRKKKRR